MDRIDVQSLSASSVERLDCLFRLYSARVLAYAETRARRLQDAEDISGDAWVRAVRSIHQLKTGDADALRWLYTLTRHAAIDYYRPKRTTERLTDFSDVQDVRRLPAVESADVDVVAVAELTARQAVCVKLAARGLTNSAIAARIGRNSGTVYRHIHRGARKLRAELAVTR
ncbi:hypothetical protein SXANM310S_00017 [Streptomyces xanthochromogenes]